MIYVECWGDTSLVKGLGFSKRMFNHRSGKGEVSSALQRNPGSIGLVDEDPEGTQPSYLTSFQRVEDQRHLGRWVHVREGKKLVVLKPDLEHWVLTMAHESSIDLGHYRLPDTAAELYDAINQRARPHAGFIKMIREYRDRNPMLRTLNRMLRA